ncbi:TPA: hypothetical protein U0921_000267 [Streptococcus suis]|uniref:hypothetical protein n=1 Tax=Streptococcus suis TaxID=1307 RepID=UPI000424D83F|nr:hypothetical protein [Streptococcus suis]HEM3172510.1 hypothetical protein [Streptococcus suis]HEM4059233.1 hypothetical protein [Streptococcus suis]
MKKSRKNFILPFIFLGILFTLFASRTVSADSGMVDNYIISDTGVVVSITNSETGLTAYLDRETGKITDIDGTVFYVKVNNSSEFDSQIPNPYERVSIPGMKPGVWNYVTTHTYNLGTAQSVQSLILGIISLLPSPASPFIGGASTALGLSSLINSNVTVSVTQYYDPARPTVIKEVVKTYKNGQYVGSTSYVRNIF